MPKQNFYFCALRISFLIFDTTGSDTVNAYMTSIDERDICDNITNLFLKVLFFINTSGIM